MIQNLRFEISYGTYKNKNRQPSKDPAADINLQSLMKIQNTTTIEWYGQCPEMWESWPEPVFYKLFLDPDGRNASLSATKVFFVATNSPQV